MLVFQKFSRVLSGHLMRRTSSSVTIAAKVTSEQPESNVEKKPKNSMVAAAFESLKEADSSHTLQEAFTDPSADAINEKLLNAKTVNGLLAITEDGGSLSRKHALKVVSILAEWSTINRVKLSDFENDSRFLKVCRVLGRTVSTNTNGNNNQNTNGNKISGFRTDDLNTVLGIAGDDEAAKLIASISLPQMVKVMSTLAHRKRRSTPLLRSLAFNISSSSEQLDLKQSADILYAMASLNFPDSVLTAKVCADIQSALPNNTDKSAVVGSILTSLGILKYRDLDVLESLSEWVLKNSEICRPQDLSALFLTLGTLNFKSSNMDQIKTKLANHLVKEDFPKPTDWLSHVWALSLLGLSEEKQVDSVLREDFIKEMENEKDGLSPNAKMKLLNINAYSKLLMNSYRGSSLIPDSPVFSVPMAQSKSKQVLLTCALDALKSLLPSNNHVKSLLDTKMGFLIDAVCSFDSKRNPLSLDKEHPNAIKIAIMTVDFHDTCHGTHRAATGLTSLCFDLLEKSNYKVVSIPYNEFNTSDKLLKRVQYLETKFKNIVNNKN